MELTAEIEIKLLCTCGRLLDATETRVIGAYEIRVKPCRDCLEEAEERGFSDAKGN